MPALQRAWAADSASKREQISLNARLLHADQQPLEILKRGPRIQSKQPGQPGQQRHMQHLQAGSLHLPL